MLKLSINMTCSGGYPVPAACYIVLCLSLPGEITLADEARADSLTAKEKE
jgi:hypothetical protein